MRNYPPYACPSGRLRAGPTRDRWRNCSVTHNAVPTLAYTPSGLRPHNAVALRASGPTSSTRENFSGERSHLVKESICYESLSTACRRFPCGLETRGQSTGSLAVFSFQEENAHLLLLGHNANRFHFAYTRRPLPPPVPLPIGQDVLLPHRFTLRTAIVNGATERYNIPQVRWCW